MQKKRDEENALMVSAVTAGKLARAQMMREIQTGTRTADFKELRTLELNIEKCERELKRSMR